MIFQKPTTASVTGFKVSEDDVKCSKCPYRIKKMGGWPLEFQHYECRAGSKPINHEKTFEGSFKDKNNVIVIAHDHIFTEAVIAYCRGLEGVTFVDYSAEDTADNRRRVVINTEKNKKGIRAKQIIYDKFFKREDAELEGINMLEYIAKFL